MMESNKRMFEITEWKNRETWQKPQGDLSGFALYRNIQVLTVLSCLKTSCCQGKTDYPVAGGPNVPTRLIYH